MSNQIVKSREEVEKYFDMQTSKKDKLQYRCEMCGKMYESDIDLEICRKCYEVNIQDDRQQHEAIRVKTSALVYEK